MWSKTRIILALFWSFFLFNQAAAQYDQTSYSIIGIGNPNWGGYSQNALMGGVGVSYGSRLFLNNLNPALLASNQEAIFQLGSSFDIRSFTQDGNSYNSIAGGVKDFGLNLPIKYSKWNLGISLNPYSNVNYGFIDSNDGAGPEGSTPVVEVEGRGGIEELSVVNSFRIKNFQLGIKTSFLFGSIQKEDKFSLTGLTTTNFGDAVVNQTKSYHSVTFGVGGLYKLLLTPDSRLNIGATYSPEFTMRQNILATLENQTSGGAFISGDTLVNDRSDKKTISIPAKFGFGLSYEKFQKLTIGLDFLSQDWASYKDENGLAESGYGSAYRVALGGEFIPNYQAQKLFSVTSYRFGVHYEQTPFLVNNETIDDIGISIGASLPLNAFWGQAYLNFGTTFGRRGNVSNGLVRENYVKIHLGFSLQDATWFTRQKFN
ncbi:hypothetical protein BFP71_04820 [Roseivirga misakiensis]|uniref:DUF5723 domain-containing protein n=2 Tax=Roseivirga misakiensis TaxID=1563681 RepID=A0A1E5T6G4_9BACT|nr:hypothetical protein BFP71_04820 [Roseivirga misakiensis]